jgi:hypothetical protein
MTGQPLPSRDEESSDGAPTEVSGGVDINSGGGAVNIGRDVIGRDRVSIHAAAGATIVIGGEGGLPLPPDRATDRPVSRVDWRALRTVYLETFDWPASLTNVWLQEQQPKWTLDAADGVYRLANSAYPDDAKYIHLRADSVDVANTPISVEVRLDDTAHSQFSAAGLLYRFDRQTKFYYAFMLAAGGQIIFYRRNAGGYRALHAGRLDDWRAGDFNRLGIVGNGAALGLYVNDRWVKTIENAEFQSGDTGIIAMSTGTFSFDNFAIYV